MKTYIATADKLPPLPLAVWSLVFSMLGSISRSGGDERTIDSTRYSISAGDRGVCVFIAERAADRETFTNAITRNASLANSKGEISIDPRIQQGLTDEEIEGMKDEAQEQYSKACATVKEAKAELAHIREPFTIVIPWDLFVSPSSPSKALFAVCRPASLKQKKSENEAPSDQLPPLVDLINNHAKKAMDKGESYTDVNGDVWRKVDGEYKNLGGNPDETAFVEEAKGEPKAEVATVVSESGDAVVEEVKADEAEVATE